MMVVNTHYSALPTKFVIKQLKKKTTKGILKELQSFFIDKSNER